MEVKLNQYEQDLLHQLPISPRDFESSSADKHQARAAIYRLLDLGLVRVDDQCQLVHK